MKESIFLCAFDCITKTANVNGAIKRKVRETLHIHTYIRDYCLMSDIFNK